MVGSGSGGVGVSVPVSRANVRAAFAAPTNELECAAGEKFQEGGWNSCYHPRAPLVYVVAFGPAASKPRQPLGRDEPLPADCAILVVPANARRPPAARAAATGQAAVWTPLTLALDAGTTAIAPVVLVLYFTGVIHGT